MGGAKRRSVCSLVGAAGLICALGGGAHLLAQTNATRLDASQPGIAPTMTLGEVDRRVKLQDDDSEVRYQNGFFTRTNGSSGRVRIWDKDGHPTVDFVMRLEDTPKARVAELHDIAVLKDGSVVGSLLYMLPNDGNRYFALVHYDAKGKFLEQMDLGEWRAVKICAADDRTIWTLSGKEKMGHEVYSPEEGVVRNYKFGVGLVRAIVPRSTFSQGVNYATGHTAIDCSGDKIHVLTDDGSWIEYTPGADYTITKVEGFSHATFGDYWQLSGFGYLSEGHAYAVIHSVPGDPFRRMLAELLPGKDGRLRWVEVPPEKTLPANSHRADATSEPTDKPSPLIEVIRVVGADHEDGESLVYRTTADEDVVWSKPQLGGAAAQAIPKGVGP